LAGDIVVERKRQLIKYNGKKGGNGNKNCHLGKELNRKLARPCTKDLSHARLLYASQSLRGEQAHKVRAGHDKNQQFNSNEYVHINDTAVRRHFLLKGGVEMYVFQGHKAPSSRCHVLFHVRVTRIILPNEMWHTLRYIANSPRPKKGVSIHVHPASVLIGPFRQLIKCRHGDEKIEFQI